jgi:hypothetical protein
MEIYGTKFRRLSKFDIILCKIDSEEPVLSTCAVHRIAQNIPTVGLSPDIATQ